MLNFNLTTSDGATIGVWHVLPSKFYAAHVAIHAIPTTLERALPQAVFDQALAERPTILYFHGNAASRAAFYRVATAKILSAEDYNVVVIDYRWVMNILSVLCV